MYRAMMIVCAFALVVSFAGQTQAADGNLSGDMLASMGLSNMQSMSDVQGQEVRGKGFVAFYSSSRSSALGTSGNQTQVGAGRVRNNFSFGTTSTSLGFFGTASTSYGGGFVIFN